MPRSLTYSAAAINVMADWADIHPEQMAIQKPYAGDESMHAWMEALGARFAAGLPVYRVPGQFYTMDELAVIERGEAASLTIAKGQAA